MIYFIQGVIMRNKRFSKRFQHSWYTLVCTKNRVVQVYLCVVVVIGGMIIWYLRLVVDQGGVCPYPLLLAWGPRPFHFTFRHVRSFGWEHLPPLTIPSIPWPLGNHPWHFPLFFSTWFILLNKILHIWNTRRTLWYPFHLGSFGVSLRFLRSLWNPLQIISQIKIFTIKAQMRNMS